MLLLCTGVGRIWPLLWHLSIIWYSKKISNPAYHVQLVERIIFKKKIVQNGPSVQILYFGVKIFSFLKNGRQLFLLLFNKYHFCSNFGL